MSPAVSICVVAITSTLIGGALGYILGGLRKCEACFRTGKSAGLGEAGKRVEELEAIVAEREKYVADLQCQTRTDGETIAALTDANGYLSRKTDTLTQQYVSRDNAAIDAGAELVRRDRTIADLRSEISVTYSTGFFAGQAALSSKIQSVLAAE